MPSDESTRQLPVPSGEPYSKLAGRIGCGDRAAEGDLVEHFLPRVRLMLEARLGDRDAASDLAQEVLLAVIQALRSGRVEDENSLPSYVWGTTRNMLKGHFDRRRRAGVDVDDLELTSGDDPEKAAETNEQMDLARRAIDGLKMSDRRILLLILVDGLKPREVAERLGMRADLVRQRKLRGLRAIRRSMEEMSRNGLPVD